MAGYSKIWHHGNSFEGGEIYFCGSFDACWTNRGYITCNKCQRQKGSKLLRRELKIILGFYQQPPAYRLANDLGLIYKTVRRVVQRLRETTYHVSELEASRLKGEIESDEAYFSKNWVV